MSVEEDCDITVKIECELTLKRECYIKQELDDTGSSKPECDVYIDQAIKEEVALAPEESHQPAYNNIASCSVKGEHSNACDSETPQTDDTKLNLTPKHTCKICKRKYMGLKCFKNHTKKCSSENTFSCNLCSKKFFRKHYLKRHTFKCHISKPFLCDLCDRKFTDKTKFINHIKRHVGSEYLCGVCKRCFDDKYSLDVHVRTHTEEEPFACDRCDQRFSQRSTLTQHYEIHVELKRFKCKKCLWAFDKEEDLDTHMRTHGRRKKTFLCDFCSKKFSASALLTKHRKEHVCHKTSLKTHM